MTDMKPKKAFPKESSDTLDIGAWVESSFWIVAAITPVFWWLQGESVSTDQFVVRITLEVTSLLGAICLRINAVVRR